MSKKDKSLTDYQRGFQDGAGATVPDWQGILPADLHEPDLLEALQAIAAFDDSEDGADRIMSFRWSAVESARAAIAKAT